jgi:hypothetical protein
LNFGDICKDIFDERDRRKVESRVKCATIINVGSRDNGKISRIAITVVRRRPSKGMTVIYGALGHQ